MEMRILDSIDVCYVYNYAYAQAGELSYLYEDQSKHGQELEENEYARLYSGLVKLNEELQGDKTNDLVYVLSTVEQLKQQLEKLEWAYELVRLSKKLKDNETFIEGLRSVGIPYDLNKIKSKLGKIRTQLDVKLEEYKDIEEKAVKAKTTPGMILDHVSGINILLDGKYIDSRTTSLRDYSNYLRYAEKIHENNIKKKAHGRI